MKAAKDDALLALAAACGRSRNWGLICGFGYGFAAATFAFIILLFVTAPHA